MLSKDRLSEVAPRAFLTIVAGAGPATLLCVLPTIFLVGMFKELIESFFTGDPGIDASLAALVFMTIWSGAAVYGTISLWLVAFTGPTRAVIIGLVAGLLAISPILFAAIQDVPGSIGSASPAPLWIFGPSATAIGWLVVAAIDWFREGGLGTDTEAD